MKPDEPPLYIRRAQDVLIAVISGGIILAALVVLTLGAAAILMALSP